MSEQKVEQGTGTPRDPAIVRDHAFMAPQGEPWGRCVRKAAVVRGLFIERFQPCGLAEAAHRDTDDPYRDVLADQYGLD